MPALNVLLGDHETQLRFGDANVFDPASVEKYQCCKLQTQNKDGSELQQGIQRRVHFQDDETVHFIEGRIFYSVQEFRDYWHSFQDLQTFKKDVMDTIAIYQRTPDKIDNVKYTLRGVERCLKDRTRKRRELRSSSIRAVVAGQLCEEALVGDDAAADLAAAYSQLSSSSLLDALQIAEKDECDAKEFHISLSDPCSKGNSIAESFFDDGWIRSLVSYTPNSVKECCHSSGSTSSSVQDAAVELRGFDASWLGGI